MRLKRIPGGNIFPAGEVLCDGLTWYSVSFDVYAPVRAVGNQIGGISKYKSYIFSFPIGFSTMWITPIARQSVFIYLAENNF